MLTRFQEHLQKLYQRFQHDTFLLAVSGGLDSMVMLDLFRRSKLHIVVAHVNFGLRGRASDGDENFVRDYCYARDIRFHSSRVETKNYATIHGLSIQMAARELRYDFFRTLVSQQQADVIATAHHLNDSFETMLMGLVRGGGAEVLLGIPSSGTDLIRPMLFATRKELEEYAASYCVTWREDESNNSEDYMRNVIRHHIVPRLQEINPSLERAVERTMMKARGQLLLADRGLDEWKSAFVRQTSSEFRIAKQGLRSSEPISLLFFLLEPYGFNFDQVTDIARSLDGMPGKKFLSPAYRLVLDRDDLIIAQLTSELPSVSIARDTTEAQWGPYRLTISRASEISISDDGSVACLDEAKLTFPLTWGRWQPGDAFQPLGMSGKKKVSDFLIDRKLSLVDKDLVTVVRSGEDLIWLAGMRIDHRFRVTNETKSILLVRIKKVNEPTGTT